MINKILVPLDGSGHTARTIEFASNIARQEDAAIHLLHVVEDTSIPEGVMDYIHAEKIKGLSDKKIREKLRNSKWSGEQIRHVLKKYTGENAGMPGL